MAIQGPFPVEFGVAFPHGAGLIGDVSAVVDFQASKGRQDKVQARDKVSGLPVWQVDVVDFDPEAREKAFKVKILAAVQPVPPEAIPGTPVRPVVLEGMTVTPWVKESLKIGGKDGETESRLTYSVKATGLAPVRKPGDPGHKSDPGKAA